MQIAATTYESAEVLPNVGGVTYILELPEQEINYILRQIGEEKIRQFLAENY